MSDEFYQKYRPKNFKHVYGQDSVVKELNSYLKRDSVPHAIMFTGPSGVGKTTFARILKNKMACSDGDYTEINAAESSGIDVIRSINRRIGLSPLSGNCRIWVFDEAHVLTKKSGSNAQEALLKVLEERPDHAYFFLCTTNPRELLPTILSRCTPVKLSPLTNKAIEQTILYVIGKENLTVQQSVISKLVEVAEGNARNSLVLLHQIAGLETEQEQLDTLVKADAQRQAIEVARLLLNPKSKWGQLALLKSLKEAEEVEGIRHLVLGYCCAILLKQEGDKENPLNARASYIIQEMKHHLYDSKWPGFVGVCYEILRPVNDKR